MHRLARGRAALLVFVLTTTTSALAEPERPGDVAMLVSLSAPALLPSEHAHHAHDDSGSSLDGFSERMRARLRLAPSLVIARPTMLPSIVVSWPAAQPNLPLAGFTPRAAPDRVGIGRTVRLAHGRELVMDLTPSPTHCAPLVSLTF